MRYFIAFAAAVMAAGTAPAQPSCPNGHTVPDFGYGSVSCDNCLSSLVRGGVSMQRFTGRPALHQIRADGPGAGLLDEGDTLVAVDGFSITSEAAAVRLATYRTVAARFTLHRNGVERAASIAATAVCVGPTSQENTDSLARVSAQHAQVPSSPLGLGIECNSCRLETVNGRTRWIFVQLPVVVAVDRQSLAAGMGLRIGDTVWTIDDTPLTSAGGGELLSALTPMGTFKLGWRRAGQPFSASVRDGRVQAAGPSTGQLSFARAIGSAQVEVTGRGRLWTRMGVNGELQIQIDSAVITIRPTAKPPQ